jgi:uncharacterized protein YPO0396
LFIPNHCLQAPDNTLPDIIGRALLFNANAVITLQDTKAALESTRCELLETQMINKNIEAENFELRRILEQQTHSYRSHEEEFQQVETELRSELNAAVELAEKQNALTVTLESKVCAGFCLRNVGVLTGVMFCTV